MDGAWRTAAARRVWRVFAWSSRPRHLRLCSCDLDVPLWSSSDNISMPRPDPRFPLTSRHPVSTLASLDGTTILQWLGPLSVLAGVVALGLIGIVMIRGQHQQL